ncbi:MAG TPA: hypothetical protein VKB60_04735 [Terriglobales bacterium]|nr:hypothetical protein [Terriglobales bacterium]
MHRSLVYALLALALAWAATQASAQSAAAGQAAPQAGPALAPGTVLGAELSKGIDAKKAKVGQEVVAKAVADLRDNNGNLVIPRGAKLVGHVTQAQAASKEQPQSSLGIIFDKMEAKSGKQSREIGLHAGIQALAKPEPSPMAQQQEPEGAGSAGGPGGGGGAPMGGSSQPGMGGGGRNAGGMGGSSMPQQRQGGDMGGNMGGPTGQQGGSGGPALNANSHGVIGIPNLTLSPQASPTEGSVISSSRGNVKLDSGTMLVLRVIGQ